METTLRSLTLTCILYAMASTICSAQQPQLQVVSPNGGESWTVGDPKQIRWSGVAANNSVSLEYTTDNGTAWRQITNDARNLSFNWTIPNTPSTNCLIRASLQPSNNNYTQLSGHNSFVNSCSYSPDGLLGVTASDDGTAKIWNGVSGALVRTITGHLGDVMWATFSPNSSHLATASYDLTARIWDVSTGTQLFALSGHSGYLNHIEYSPDGTLLVTASEDGTAKIWNSVNGTLVRTLSGHTDGLYAAAFSPDGQYVITSSRDKTAKIWNVSNGQIIRTLPHPDVVHTAYWNPDMSRIITACRDNRAYIWNASTGTQMTSLVGHTQWVWTAEYSSDGTQIVTGGRDGLIKVWSSTGALQRTLSGHSSDVGAARFSPDATRILSGSNDRTGRIWYLSTAPLQQDVSDAVFTIAPVDYSNLHLDQPNGREVLVVGALARVQWSGVPVSTKVLLELSSDAGTNWNSVATASGLKYDWSVPNIRSTQCLMRVSVPLNQSFIALTGHSGFVNSATFSRDGSKAATSSDDNTTNIWDAATGTLLLSLQGHNDDVMWTAFSPDGSKVVTGSMDSTARIWDLTTGSQIAVLSGHAAGILHTAWSPNGSLIATASEDGTTKLWDASTAQLVRTLRLHTNGVYSVEFSPDGTKLATASRDFTARVWDVATGATVQTLVGHTNAVHMAAFSPDGQRVVTAGRDNVAKIWDFGSGVVSATLTGHTNWVWTAAFSPDGSKIVTASRDGEIRVWSVATAQVLTTLKGHNGDVGSAFFDTTGARIVSGSNDMTGRIWTLGTGTVLAQDVSDSLFKITPPNVNIIQPNGGEVLVTRSISRLRWGGVPGDAPVNIEYSLNGGTSWQHITETSGSQYDWTVPNTPSKNCLLRVSTIRDSISTQSLGSWTIAGTSGISDNDQVTGATHIISVLPNPVQGIVRLRFTLSVQEHVRCSVVDLTGVTVGSQADGLYTAGEHELSFNTAGMPAGTYSFVVRTSQGCESRLFTVIR